jgi:hypothetical protein
LLFKERCLNIYAKVRKKITFVKFFLKYFFTFFKNPYFTLVLADVVFHL